MEKQVVREYVVCLMSTAYRYFGCQAHCSDDAKVVVEETVSCRFVAGLRPELKHFVLRESPKTLEEVISLAVSEEQNLALLSKEP